MDIEESRKVRLVGWYKIKWQKEIFLEREPNFIMI